MEFHDQLSSIKGVPLAVDYGLYEPDGHLVLPFSFATVSH